MFAPFDPSARVHLGVVTLGTPARLAECLEALRSHESRHDFVVSCLVNQATFDESPVSANAPDGVRVVHAGVNLGWSGGLHRLRALTTGEYFVWVQDDMLPEPGWLDALVDAADAHPGAGGLGSTRVDADGLPAAPNAGWARPPEAVERWNESDATVDAFPGDVTPYHWVTSTGFLTRTRAWDELGGTDPRFWPVNHGDKEYCTHLRCHGWDVALVPDARVRHDGHLSSPTAFREFVAQWREPWFNGRWAGPVAALDGTSSGRVEHPCGDWRGTSQDEVEAAVGGEAARMTVPLARSLAARSRELEENLDDHSKGLSKALEVIADLRGKIEVLEQQRDRARRRVRRLRNRLP